MRFEEVERKEMLEGLGVDMSRLSNEDQRSLQLALVTFASAYLLSREARIKGLTIAGYRTMAEEVVAADSGRTLRELDGADYNRGLELLLELNGCAEQGDLQGYIAPTQKGDLAIMYVIGKTMENDGRNN